MNIEKSLDIIKGKLLMIDKMLKQDQEEGHGSAYEMQTEDFEAIETLLTAYEKEKEKNKELEKMIKKDKDALQFKVGDIVRLKYKSPCTFAIEEGAVCKITNIERQARYPIEIENKFNGVKGYVAEDYIEKIEVEE